MNKRVNSGEDLEFISVPVEDVNDSMNYSNHSNFSSNEYGEDSGSSLSMGGLGSYFNASKHPMTALFHLLFKAMALFFYMFGGWFTSSFIFTFVVVIILLAFDFWTVKNVSGRLLVGLRWWSYVKPDGSNEWIFESLEDMGEISNFDSRLFWGALYATPAVWGLLLVVGFLRFSLEYLPVVVCAIAMSMANIIGYLKCSNSAEEKMKNLMQTGLNGGNLLSSAMGNMGNNSVTNWVFNALIGSAGSGGTGSGGSGSSPGSTSSGGGSSNTNTNYREEIVV